jgi:hypothetical protein
VDVIHHQGHTLHYLSSVENTTENRNVSENEKSTKTRGTMKNVSYTEIVKKGKLSNDTKEVNKSK